MSFQKDYWLLLPLWLHTVLAAIVLTAVYFVAAYCLTQAGQKQVALHSDIQQLNSQIARMQFKAPDIVRKDFSQTLPSNEISDAVVRDMTGFAQTQGISLSSLVVVPQSANTQKLGSVQYNLNAAGTYLSTKAWLGDMLARYPSLSLQSMTVTGSSSEPSKQEYQLVLMQYLKA